MSCGCFKSLPLYILATYGTPKPKSGSNIMQASAALHAQPVQYIGVLILEEAREMMPEHNAV